MNANDRYLVDKILNRLHQNDRIAPKKTVSTGPNWELIILAKLVYNRREVNTNGLIQKKNSSLYQYAR